MKVVDRVVVKLSPGARRAAAAWSVQLLLPPSTPGRLCQGSMQTKWIFSDSALQIRV